MNRHDNANATVNNSRPSVSDLDGDNVYAVTARKHWFQKDKIRFDPKVVSSLFAELERDNWAVKSLLILENLQYVERYLWPNFNEDSTDLHVLSLALMLDMKRRENLPIWDIFTSSETEFTSFFRRTLALGLNTTVSLNIRIHIISFVITAFQSLDSALVRKQCAPLVSIGLWHNLSSQRARDDKFEKYPQYKKVWKAATKRFEASDDKERSKLSFERSWLSLVITEFLNLLYASPEPSSDVILYCERVVEFLTDLVSQMPTRRYVKVLLEDLHILVAIKMSHIYQSTANGLFRDMFNLLSQFLQFTIDEQTGQALSTEEIRLEHYEHLAKFQRICLKLYKEKLTILSLSNLATIEKREELQTHLSTLNDVEFINLCQALHVRVEFPAEVTIELSRSFLMEVLLTNYTKRKDIVEIVQDLPILPTEISLYDPILLRNERYDGNRSLALPKMNLQYLTVSDFLWRTFVLYRSESYFEIRRDIEEALLRLRPQFVDESQGARFNGFSRMALPVNRPSILEVAPPRIGEDKPALVRAEIELSFDQLSEDVKRDWEDLKPDDVVFLIAVKGYTENSGLMEAPKNRFGIESIRSAEVIQMLDSDNRPIKQPGRKRAGKRRLHVKIDSVTYQADRENELNGSVNIYDSINLILRRKGIVNNFKPILGSIQKLIKSTAPLPTWFQDIFLGYGNPSNAHYSQWNSRPKQIDYCDTFLDWPHLVQCLGTDKLQNAEDDSISPPYVLKEVPATGEQAAPTTTTGMRKKREVQEVQVENQPLYRVSSYKLPNNGPFPVDAPKKNKLRYTPAQAEAVINGTNPGLTVVLGPPGTGKTDVATQIVSNIYHNFPTQRTLLISHSNQALNQLFQKITELDIDERHLLRLGHGEEHLKSTSDYSKSGRVESFMDNRAQLLSQVDRLAISLSIAGAHGNSCETAGYFFRVHIAPKWEAYESRVLEDVSNQSIVSDFPFTLYFSNAPQPLFPPDRDSDEHREIARGCFKHIKKIFTELDDILPFELLRNGRDKANYLLMKEARIIAMTSTHAAIKRDEIVKQGFLYDNVIIEEAAQMTEIETFIPLTLQLNGDNITSLQRIILCGDHYQNSPIIQHRAFREYAKMEQSMFARLARLGVPTIKLDKQGRARPSIAELYNWRYQFLGNLDYLNSIPEFLSANAGFAHALQFINVEDYKGQGEQEPTRHFIQNLGEAEYAVAIFQYMRLLGYPAAKITILTSYAGQQSLIKDVLKHRCLGNPLFGNPAHVTTIDKYQGEQNDYIILSLVRTKRIGYLRDIRRITVAFSRARLGLYILGRRKVFESSVDLTRAFEYLFAKPDKLQLVTGEMWPSQRSLEAEVTATEMEGVEHLGQYVYEMTNTRIRVLAEPSANNGTAAVAASATNGAMDVDMDADEEDVEE